MSTNEQAFFRRHPVIALVGFNLALLLVLLIAVEVVLRLSVNYNPGYYVSVSGTSTELEFPYGTIKINSDGYPDSEFDRTKPHKIGYYGDSVTYGVGAGYGYRISDLLEEEYPEAGHFNFGGTGLSISDGDIEFAAKLAKRFELDRLVYLVNLNDILPDAVASGEVTTVVGNVRSEILSKTDWLRGRSYTYTWLRNLVRDLLAARGTGFHGYPTFELFPNEHGAVIAQTAGRINKLDAALAEGGTELILVILPYEMQISEEAAEVYASHGIQWEPDFISGETQRVLMRHLDADIPTYDALAAFVDAAAPDGTREQIPIGHFFVYDRGDKLDWNHPTREGHAKIAAYLIDQKVLPDTLR